jgi:hypothetical protein
MYHPLFPLNVIDTPFTGRFITKKRPEFCSGRQLVSCFFAPGFYSSALFILALLVCYAAGSFASGLA